jgi:ribose 5-phosphate isomerase A
MNDKQIVAIHAAKMVKKDMCVGLGTGSTANFFIEALAQRNQSENLNIRAVSSSMISQMKAQQLGLPLVSIQDIEALDLYVDGADEISPALTLLKGRGQDLVMEKLLAQAAKQFIVVADQSKLVRYIGEKFVIPMEVRKDAANIVLKTLKSHGAEGQIRLNSAGDNVAISAQGNLILDLRFPQNLNEEALDHLLNQIPGIVEHGIFRGLTDQVLIVNDGKIETIG